MEFLESFIGFVNGKTTDTFFSVAVAFRCCSPQNHRYFLRKTLARWFFYFAHCKTTDTIWLKIWDWFFPWNFPDGRSAISSATKTFFYFNVICCNNRNRITERRYCTSSIRQTFDFELPVITVLSRGTEGS